jgi:DME family drug/metabolite transporter
LFALSVRPARISFALLVTAGVLWGIGGLAGAVLQSVGGLSPVSVAAYRLLVGGGLVFVVVARVGRLRYLRGRAAVGRLVVSGGLLALFQVAYQFAVTQISVSLATLITIGCVPVFVAGVCGVRERAVPSGRTLTAIGGSLVGLVLLSGGAAGGNGWQTAGGVAMALLAGAGFAALTVLTARSVPGQHVVTSVGLLVGGLFLTPFALISGMGFGSSATALSLVCFLGVVPTAVAYGAYFLGLRHAQPTAAALAAMLEPLTATVLAVLLHGERFDLAGAVGAALIACSVALYYLRR